MSGEEINAVARISPQLAAVVVALFALVPVSLPVLQWLADLWTHKKGGDLETATVNGSMRLIDQLQEEITSLRKLDAGYSAELEQLRLARMLTTSICGELYVAAIAARTMLHDLERRNGVPETLFPPLPALPGMPGAGDAKPALTAQTPKSEDAAGSV